MTPPPDGTARLRRSDLLEGARRILPLSLYVAPMGLAFGVAAIQAGMSPIDASLASALVFAGASQFAALDLWNVANGMGPLLLAVFAVNARHIVFSASLAPWLNRLPIRHRLGMAFLVSDANWALVTKAREEEWGATPWRLGALLLGAGATLWVVWLASTIAGAALHAGIGNLSVLGLDLMPLTFFATIVVSLWRRARLDLPPWLVAAFVAVAASHVLPHGWHVIAGGVAGGIVGALRREG